MNLDSAKILAIKIFRPINLPQQITKLFFFEAKDLTTQQLWVPLSVQMPLLCYNANAANGITTSIGASFPSSLSRRNVLNLMLFTFVIIALIISSFPLTAQAQLNTDIYLIDINLKGDNLNYSNLTNITNRQGYDNQPHFSSGGSHLLYSSIRADEQADIYKYEIQRGETKQLTNTKANEFSPTYFKGGKFMSAVQQDVDSTQHLIQLKLKNGKRKVLLKNEKLIGYHSWINHKEVALFIVGEPHELHRAKRRARSATKIDDKIGSALQKVPYRRAVGYQFFEDTATCVMKEYYYKTKIAKTICSCAPKAASFVYLKNGNIISGIGQQLFLFNKKAAAKGWVLVADFSDIPGFDFYRIAINQQETQMALVAYRKE